MKKWIYLILLSTGLLAAGCVDEVDDLFDDSASQRMDATLQNIRDILVNAPNGWKLNYYPDPTTYGGYTLLLSFKADGTVDVSAEKELLVGGIVEQMTNPTRSLYQLKSDTGPILTFDTYNNIFHAFSDPNPDGIGLGGDYEFVVLETATDRIELIGKKGEARMTLRRLAETESWEHYLRVIDSVASLAVATGFQVTIDGKLYSSDIASGRGRNLILTDENGDEVAQMAYHYTPTGISLYEPLTLNGKQIQNFEYRPAQEILSCTDPGTTAEISLIFTDINQYFLHSTTSWYFDTKAMGPLFLLYWNTAARTLQQKTGERFYDASIGYSPLDGLWFFDFTCSADGLSGNSGVLSFIPSLMPATKDQVLLLFEGRADQTGVDYYQQNGISYIIAGLMGQTGTVYTITPDNVRFPRKLTFTSNTQPDLWFTLNKQVVKWP